ncbi:HutD/Ves family protein [Acidocella sp.]|uniref:HutD/Ves family protein n=1 Tax=Acidocella sp. TaxID=50710 RepID=UPI003D08276B
MDIFPAAARPESPWKNGGGITRPVASAPGGRREFGWRLSLADVEQAGPFSVFPGISRLMGILEGRLRLEVAGLEIVELTPGGPAFAFPGDAPTHGAPLAGKVRDINLMFDPDCYEAALDHAPAGLERPAGKAAHLVLALAPLRLNGTALGALDAALVPAGEAVNAYGGALWIATLTRI